MDRKVYLTGEMKEKFGSEFSMHAKSYADIIKNIDCNRPGFKKYLVDSYNNGIDFIINFAGKDIEEKELFIPLKEGDVTISTVPAGSKSDAARIVIGTILTFVSQGIGASAQATAAYNAKNAIYLGPGYATEVSAVTAWATTAGQAIGVNLAMQGLQGIMAPDPSTDAEQDPGYLYGGSTNIITEGDPVPLLYGELRVPGQPISVALNTKNNNANILAGEDPNEEVNKIILPEGITSPDVTVDIDLVEIDATLALLEMDYTSFGAFTGSGD